MLNTVFWAVVVLGILIFVHELGHFLVARFFGVQVLVFSLGFGPRIGGWKGKTGTEYQLSAVPLGGYVKMLGESGDPDEEIPEASWHRSFGAQKVAKRFAIVFAGPLFNFLFAIVALVIAFMVGVGETLPVVGSVSDGMPAHKAGIQVGDRIVALNGVEITRWETMSRRIKELGGDALVLTIERAQQRFDLTVIPQIREVKDLFGEPVRHPLIGIAPSGEQEVVHYSFFKAMIKGVQQTWMIMDLTVTSIWKLVTRVIPADQIGGPLMIAEMAGKTAQQGATSLLFFMALISVNLGILNLLPVPILDGGHLFFFMIEAIKGGPVTDTVQAIANRVGLALLVLLMVWAMKNDLTRLFAGEF
ncbi:MAG: RIP metalloprotease RseP [Magnetococcales bacterium]|nr:RIP metalloprotease RseP [Magnetococcales bacterium]MBF0347727.1 RIP metalloprotease RseP [Magnetococcales bacterium]MBF0631380.1 RIP metalloprotease RseP [Magnetococcales bacterium]